MPKLLLKPGVVLDRIAPGGMRILEALKVVSKEIGLDITITCGNEGHTLDDPHTLGRAIDFRTHDWAPELKQRILRLLLEYLQQGPKDVPIAISDGLATMHFWGWIEHPGAVDEHGHIQQRKGVAYTMGDYLAA